MRIHALLIYLLLIVSASAMAEKLEGRIFYDNDTLIVTMLIPMNPRSYEPDYEKLQTKVKCIDP